MSKRIKQRDVSDCGAACIASLAAHYRLHVPIARIRQYALTDQKGTTVLGMLEALEKIGFDAKGVRGKTDSLSKIPLPAVAHILVEKSLHHFIVVVSVGKRKIELMDPADGKFHIMAIPEFEKTWTGVLVLAVPNNNFSTDSSEKSILNKFMLLLQPHRQMVVQSIIGAIIFTTLGLSLSIYVQKIVDYVFLDGNRGLLNMMSLGMLGLLGLQALIGFIKNTYALQTGQQLDAALMVSYYRHLMRLPQRFFDTMRVGEIINRFNDAIKIRAFVNEAIHSIILNLFIVVFSIALMFSFYWKLGVLVITFIPVYVLLYFVTRWKNSLYERVMMEKSAVLESHLVESTEAIRTIKAFGLEAFSSNKMETKFFSLLNTSYRSGSYAIISGTLSEFFSKVLTILVLWLGAGFVLENEITPGELLSFYALLAYFTGPLTSLISVNKTIQSAVIAAERLFEIMDLEQGRLDGKIDLERNYRGKISFRNVTFGYGNGPSLLDDFNLDIQPGHLIALVGESGSGKSTLISLLQDLYPLHSGQVYIGDYNLKHISNDSLRRWMAIVPQRIDLFDGNIIENIAVGCPRPDIQKIHRICKEIGILEFIEGLPTGFATPIGENGVSLSGGQRQRIAIARALYRDPQLLILDEATSAIDSESENYILGAIDWMRSKGKTVIMVTHRLSIAARADRILVLRRGKIIEDGFHEKLLAAQGLYYKMWQTQHPESSRG